MRRPSLRSDRAFFYCLQYHCLSFILITSLQTYCRTAEGVHLSLRFTFFVTLSVPRSCRHTTHSQNALAPRVRWFHCFLASIAFSFLRPMATSHRAAVCCFFVFACAKVIIHSIANARTGTPCLSINLHAIRVVFNAQILAFIP